MYTNPTRCCAGMTLELVPLFTCTISLATPMQVSSSLMIGEVTRDERYAWINRIQGVAKGTFTAPDTLVDEMYELR